MALHYIVQGHRYDIVENFGCQPTTYFSIEGIIIVWLPPLVFAIATLVYAALALYHFACRRMNFAAHLQNSNPALTTNRYLRLMTMAVTEIVWGTALTAFNLYNNVDAGLQPWISWQNVHSDWLRIDLFAFIELSPSFIKSMFLLWWAMPASAYIFFLFFGFSDEARKEYSKIIKAFQKHVLRQSIKDVSFHESNLPSARHRGLKIAPLPSVPLADDEKSSNESSSSRSIPTPFRPSKKFNHVTFPNASGIPPPKYAPDIEAGLSDDSHSDQIPHSFIPWEYSSHQSSQRPLLSYDYPHPRAPTTSIVLVAGPKPSHPYVRPWSPPIVLPLHSNRSAS
jgi:pheromone a factor receptor